jgi:diaminopimelate epimerase
MSKQIPFYKMVASGNDFVVIDNRKKMVKDPLAMTRQLCALHTGVGADGILLVENSRKADFKMRIINSDGSEAEACGNGFRCIALFAREKMGYPQKFQFESLSGVIEASVGKSGQVKVQLVRPTDIRLRDEIQVMGHRLHYSFLNTGVPHTVIFVEGLAKIDVAGLGRAIRYHERFKPRGTNVNFAEVASGRQINVRTYERGVENETLACGTGSTASALASALLGYTKPPVKVKTSGGEILTVDFRREGDKITSVTLEGEAKFVFEGNLMNGVQSK